MWLHDGMYQKQYIKHLRVQKKYIFSIFFSPH
jgi:hypothetical protein